MRKVSQYTNLAVGVLDRIVRPRVSKVTIPVTYDCNQKCKTCDIWKINKEDPSLRAKEVAVEEFGKFLQVNRLLWVALTGGEPFLRKDMSNLLEEALTHCSLVSVTTNGFDWAKLTQDVGLGLSRSRDSLLAVNVSFEGPQDIHDMVTGTEGSYRRALSTLKALRALGNPRLRVGVSYTTSSYNEGRFLDFVQEMGRDFPGLNALTYGIGQDSPSYYQDSLHRVKVAPQEEEVRQVVNMALPSFKGYSPFTWVGRKYLEGLVNGRRPKCVAGTYSLMLDPYWNVYPCMFFCPSTPVGNLREVDFDLRKLDYARIKDLVGKCKIPCWTPCEAYSTIVFRPWRVLR